MTPHRQKIAADAVNESLQILFDSAARGTRAKPTVAELNAILEKLGAAKAALNDRLWEHRI